MQVLYHSPCLSSNRAAWLKVWHIHKSVCPRRALKAEPWTGNHHHQMCADNDVTTSHTEAQHTESSNSKAAESRNTAPLYQFLPIRVSNRLEQELNQLASSPDHSAPVSPGAVTSHRGALQSVSESGIGLGSGAEQLAEERAAAAGAGAGAAAEANAVHVEANTGAEAAARAGAARTLPNTAAAAAAGDGGGNAHGASSHGAAQVQQPYGSPRHTSVCALPAADASLQPPVLRIPRAEQQAQQEAADKQAVQADGPQTGAFLSPTLPYPASNPPGLPVDLWPGNQPSPAVTGPRVEEILRRQERMAAQISLQLAGCMPWELPRDLYQRLQWVVASCDYQLLLVLLRQYTNQGPQGC